MRLAAAPAATITHSISCSSSFEKDHKNF